MTSSIFKGIVAGFFATLIMGLAMYAAAGLYFYPPLIHRLTLISHHVINSPLWLWIGWAYHFAIGTLAWGILFGLFAWAIRARSGFGTWFTAIVFAACAWVLMMIIVMPLSNAGFFAINAGWRPLIVMAIWHFIWGTVLGLTFYALTKPDMIEHTVYERIIAMPIFRGFRWRRTHSNEELPPPSEEPPPPIEPPPPRHGEPAHPVEEPPPRPGERF